MIARGPDLSQSGVFFREIGKQNEAKEERSASYLDVITAHVMIVFFSIILQLQQVPQ